MSAGKKQKGPETVFDKPLSTKPKPEVKLNTFTF